ncbi:MAG TPA: adenosylmethionine--8-amino-7-oxononanoate transaminase [Vicinamibacterales bacterium]|nr:adenosylmethionine--8-amino-7-oxononanoate transaminase [Vicinamibacterales bacterium]
MTGTLVDRDRACLWHPYTQMRTAPPPLPIVRGEGVYLFTDDGRRLLDGISSWWVNIHGHAHPALNAALAAQAARLEHVVFAGCTHPPAVELAERLVAALPAGLTRVFYSDNGSTAVEVALKLACQYWGNRNEPLRRNFVALQHAYHGDTVGAMSASEDSIFTRPFAPMLFAVQRVHAPYCYRCPLGLERSTCNVDCLGDLERVLKKDGDTIAGVIVEPMLQGAGGMIVWPWEFLAGIRRLCDRHGVLMIADEVLTGFGRTGRMFACEHASVSPDIICLSKALTGGYLPLGVTATTEPVYSAFLSDDRARTFFHGHSFTANPLACAVAIASLRLFDETEVLERVRHLEGWLRQGLAPLASLPVVGDVRVLGGVGALELVTDNATKNAGGYLDGVGPRLAAAFVERGLLLRPLGNILYFMPPFVITESETAWAIAEIRDVLSGLRA